MKTVVLVRHGKAEKYTDGTSDFKRHLTGRGRKDAETAATRLEKRGCVPTLIITSPAPRAWETARIAAGVLGYKKKKIEECPELYEQEPDIISRLIDTAKKKHDTIMIVGHNPLIENAARMYADEFDVRVAHLPTSGVVVISFDVDRWDEVARGTGDLVAIDAPDKTAGKI